jgi:sec-independent protein translocase protein TatA
MGLGPWEIFWIFLAILLIFGGKKIPEIARAMGKGMNEFNKAKREITESLNEPETDYKKPEKEIKSEENKKEKNE